ncbi:hypothetical protein N1851_020579 [Merluccius polli]|uniref:Apolipoprotein L3 n=1 Tax=Merluccius polli TaxID=89951 RepID=A0AA47NYC8_MERPO|nr:hypothetical protein N1851_020579 [Merluccius polli]
MATADQLLELIFSWIDQRELCAEQLRKLARELESLRKKCNGSECVGSSVSVVGAACLIGAGAATVFTGGAAAPFLAFLGGVYSGVGVTISVVTKITEHFLSSDTMEEAQKIEKKSNDIAEKIQKLFKQLKEERKEGSSFTDDELDRHVMTEILGAVARRSGLKQKIIDSMYERMDFFNAEPGYMRHNHSFHNPNVMVALAGILMFFTFEGSGKKYKLLFAEGAKQLIKQMSTTGLKTALKGGAMVVGGAVGMAFALPEAIDNWKDQIKNNHVTEASQSLRDTADEILKMTRTLKRQFDNIKEMFEELADVKRCIENSNRSSKEKETLIKFAIKYCKDEDVRQWLRENSESVAFFKLVDMFHFLEQELDKKKKKIDRKDIDIIFVAHGAIEESKIPASCLLPLSTIKDVLLYSPWNCTINAGVAYGVATGCIQPQHRRFSCRGKGCQIPDERHRPTSLPNRWNSMKAAGGRKIPNIIVVPLRIPKDGAWEGFKFLKGKYGEPEKNRIVIPFILPGEIGSSLRLPFFVITLALSLVLCFTSYEATVHLAACLSKISAQTKLSEDDLKAQYACTIDKTRMTYPENMLSAIDGDTNLYRALKAVFG